MNIMMANWAWYPTGGDWTYIDHTRQLYEEYGHSIVPFSVSNPSNLQTDFSKFFLDSIDYRSLNKNRNILNGVKVLKRAIYSKEAQRKIIKLIDSIKIDVAQMNNINNYITPSIIPILKRRHIPVIWRILDYRIVCPNISLITGNKICEACNNKRYYHCLAKKCKRGSYSASFIASLESYVHRFLKIYDKIDAFVFQNQFSLNKFRELGFRASKAVVINNPYNVKNIIPDYKQEGYVLYFGRIEKMKGIYTLVDAMQENPDIPLKIIGGGEELENVLSYIKNKNISNITYHGAKWGEELKSYLSKASFVVVPSEWYEVSPYALLEAFAYGKPAIVSDIGGLPEMVTHNVNGLLFKSNNKEELSIKIKQLYSDSDRIVEMGKNARKKVETEYTYENYYCKSIDLFKNLNLQI